MPDQTPQPGKARRRGLNSLTGLRSLLVSPKWFSFTRILDIDTYPTAQLSPAVKPDVSGGSSYGGTDLHRLRGARHDP